MTEKRVLFICIENAARSLMAEAMFNADPPPGWQADSAGTVPAPAPNPRTVPMLAELGLALPAHPPQVLTPERMNEARIRVTLGCMDDASCPAYLKTLETVDWALPNPASLDDQGFRNVRDRLRDRVNSLKTEIALRERRARGLQP
ncbi:MAG: hypothetical protein L3K17_01500 [Thermoplasmata archaeon]|nr:hypothetical protein [Thermoplasmata archaeon]